MTDELGRLLASDAFREGRVLDLRPARRFEAGHLPGACSLPLEEELLAVPAARRADWLTERLPSIFLPPRHESLAVVAGSGELAREVARELAGRGRAGVAAAALTPERLAGLSSSLLEAGPSRHRLWRPPPFLERWSGLLPPQAAGPVLDLACGSGRAAVWLAERGWRVTGIDHQPEALALAARLAAHHGVELRLREADLRRPGTLPPGPWAAVLLFRFLERPLLARLTGVLSDGAVVMLRTFRHAPGYIGNPQPRHRLARGEAARLLPSPPSEVLVHEEGFDQDGRPAAGVVVRWRATAP